MYNIFFVCIKTYVSVPRPGKACVNAFPKKKKKNAHEGILWHLQLFTERFYVLISAPYTALMNNRTSEL